ncbi:DUF4145 domain-containing protein [Robiginitalea sp. M366]|uniref:DUF4145 domain-containing protein n=1 Tax=Robiginitalea aestuariiviva TaxID=3036903 RepID=UPI00240E684B|nr:DUF4145 domain-containing protein [Robiginitalea aestuariiviva]MDG1573422.1 DUF4145 domain-containing protein [Robiginitalea aestuariiviva]
MKLENYLLLDRCPHCKIDSPSLRGINQFTSSASDGSRGRIWKTYLCERCGGAVNAFTWSQNGDVAKWFPESSVTDESIPDKAKAFLDQAKNSIHAPSGAIMLSASAVDAMLKDKGYKKGSLYARINSAVEDHLITENMATWAHEVRLDANDERHADDDAELPNTSDAEKAVDFALALAEYLFVFPSKVQRGIKDATESTSEE